MNKRFDIELGVFLHELSKNTFDCDGFDSLDFRHRVDTLLAWWAFLILANISESESLKAILFSYQLDLTTPGKSPDIESSRSLILDKPNFL